MADFEARDPDYESRVRASFLKQQFMVYLGAEMTSAHPGFCEIRLPFRPELTQQNGFFHGGIVGTLADNAAGYASYSLMAATDNILTVEYKLNIVAPADGSELIARGHVLRPGRTLTVARSEVYALKNGIEVLCGSAQATMMRMEGSLPIK